MTGPLNAPGPTAVRIAGDHYQWLTAWSGCVQLLHDADAHPENPVVSVGVEVPGVGNLDDVVLVRTRPPTTYQQVKYTVDSTSPVNTAWLTADSPNGGPSLLRKVATTWAGLVGNGAPVDLRIVTNRAPDPGDVLIAGRDARTRLLLPVAGRDGPRSRRGAARTTWAAAAGLSEPELFELLGVLRFDLARDSAQFADTISLQMLACGLRHDHGAVTAGASWVAEQVRNGTRSLDLVAVQRAVEALGLRTATARTVLSVATLKPDPLAETAAYAIDWADRFDGADPWTRRHPKPPATWAELQHDIDLIPQRLHSPTRVLVTGSFRQAPAFAIGAALRMASGTDLAVVQRGRLWSSLDSYTAVLLVDRSINIDQGRDIAVAVEIATDISGDVERYLHAAGVPASRLMVLGPPGGPSDQAVPDGPTACALTVSIRDAVRHAVPGHTRVHLFLGAPMGLALLLGHRWNRIAPTTVYEDLGASDGYEPAFQISA